MRKQPIAKQKFKHGFVSAKYLANGKWLYDYTDSNGKRFRRVVPAADREEALKIAKAYNIEIAASKGIPGMRKLKSGFSLREAIRTWLQSKDSIKPKTKADYRVVLNAFGKHMGESFPTITHWELLKPEHVEHYMDSINRSSWSTRRRHLVVIRMISNELHRSNKAKYADFAKEADVRLQQCTIEDRTLPRRRQIQHMIEWFLRRYPAIGAMLALEYYVGLRGFEACFLLAGDIDFKRKTITLDDTDVFVLKTDSSKRVIPIQQRALDALLRYRNSMKVQPVNDKATFFLNHYNQPWTESGICTSRTKAFKAYKEYLADKGLPIIPPTFKLRELRSVFITEALRAGVSESLLQKYVGHAPTNVMRKHYFRPSVADFLEGVVAKLEATYRMKNFRSDKKLEFASVLSGS